MKASIHRSRTVLFYCLFRVFEDFGLIYPVYTLLFLQRGLSYVQISLLIAVWAGTMLLLEVPSGILADLWSRKAVIALGTLLKGAGFLVWAVRPDFIGFLLGFILWGAEEAFCSGTTEAMLFDALGREGLESSYEAAAGAGEVAGKAGIVTAMVAGGFLFERDPGATLVLSALPMLLAGLFVLFIPEGRDRPADRSAPLPRIGRAVREAARTPGLLPFVLLGGVVGASYGAMEEFDTLYGLEVGVPVGFLGLWGAARFLAEGTGAAFSRGLRRRLRLYRPGRLLLWMAAAALLLLAGTLAPAPLLVPLYFAYYAMIGPALVIYEGALQRRIGPSGRATVSSLASFLTTGAGMGLGLLFGLAAGSLGLPSLFRIGAAVTLTAVAGYALAARRAGRRARSRQR